MWLLSRFRVHFLGYRTLQTLLLVCVFTQTYLYCYPSLFINPLLPLACIFTYLAPVVGILTFFILKHGWIHDLCVVYCTDYLSYLNTIQCNPNTAQDTKRSIQTILTKFEFETLMHESHKYKLSRNAVNFAYPFLSIKVMLLSVLNAACLYVLTGYTAYFIGLNSNPKIYMDVLNLVICGLILFLIVANNIQLLLVILVCPVFSIGVCIYSL